MSSRRDSCSKYCSPSCLLLPSSCPGGPAELEEQAMGNEWTWHWASLGASSESRPSKSRLSYSSLLGLPWEGIKSQNLPRKTSQNSSSSPTPVTPNPPFSQSLPIFLLSSHRSPRALSSSLSQPVTVIFGLSPPTSSSSSSSTLPPELTLPSEASRRSLLPASSTSAALCNPSSRCPPGL